MLQIILFIILNVFFILSNDSIKDYNDKGYESLLNWGLNHSLKINNNIKFVKFNKEKKYIADNDISKGEIIIDIPQEITLSINTSLSLLNTETINIKYNDYIIEHQQSNKTLNDISHREQSFMAYLLYIANNKNNNEYNSFYEYYKPFYYMFEEELVHLPSFYKQEQINLFLNTTSFGSFFELMNMYIMGEINILEKKIFNEEIKLQEYLRYRLLLVQKSYNISNQITVVPFIDIIKKEFNKNNINCRLVVTKKHIKIKAIKDIKKGEILTMKPGKVTNQYSFFFYGKTYEELIENTSSFFIPAISPDLLFRERIVNDEGNKVDLAWPNFLEIVLPMYKNLAKTLKRDDSKYACYGMILDYLKAIKNRYRNIDFKEIEDAFDDERDSKNVKRIIIGEKIFLDKKIKDLIDIMEKSKKVKIIRNKKFSQDL